MKEVRRTLKQILINSLNTDQMNHLARDLNPSFDMGEVTGFGDKIVIPRQTAAEAILRHFQKDQSLLNFIGYMISRDGQGMSGGVIQLKGISKILGLLKEECWIFDQKSFTFSRDQSVEKTSDWGHMQEGQEYLLTVASVDVVGSSMLVRTNVKIEVESTLSRLRNRIINLAEQYNGRLWFWHGDGGVLAFYGPSSCSSAVTAMISVLYNLPVFNIVDNELNLESDIRLRVGLNYGPVEYRNDVASIVSETIQSAEKIEKNCSPHNALAVSESVYSQLSGPLRSDFSETQCKNGGTVHFYRPE
ncbi:MAG: hypothetical protein OEZ34_13965 [Spirochaetia bacterium]|nr:hypothetical protein [Spirochaetia bacterium]